MGKETLEPPEMRTPDAPRMNISHTLDLRSLCNSKETLTLTEGLNMTSTFEPRLKASMTKYVRG